MKITLLAAAAVLALGIAQAAFAGEDIASLSQDTGSEAMPAYATRGVSWLNNAQVSAQGGGSQGSVETANSLPEAMPTVIAPVQQAAR